MTTGTAALTGSAVKRLRVSKKAYDEVHAWSRTVPVGMSDFAVLACSRNAYRHAKALGLAPDDAKNTAEFSARLLIRTVASKGFNTWPNVGYPDMGMWLAKCALMRQPERQGHTVRFVNDALMLVIGALLVQTERGVDQRSAIFTDLRKVYEYLRGLMQLSWRSLDISLAPPMAA